MFRSKKTFPGLVGATLLVVVGSMQALAEEPASQAINSAGVFSFIPPAEPACATDVGSSTLSPPQEGENAVCRETADPLEQAAGQGDQHRKGCPRGIRSCPASEVGQRCDPNNPALICSAQANGTYCCLAYAGAVDDNLTEPAGVAASGGGPCCTHQDKTSCQASCEAAGCVKSIAACINLRCSCRCFGCPFVSGSGLPE